MRTKYLLILGAALLLAACAKTRPSITTEHDEILIDFEGGPVNLKVSCNVETMTTVTYEQGDGWIFLMPRHLWGNGVLSFTIDRYSGMDEDRHAVATIVGDGIEKAIRITQTHKPKPVATDLDLDRTNIYADVEGGSWTISVTTAGDWTATSSAAWCKIDQGSGSGPGAFKVTVEPSTDYQYRTVEILVKSGTLERKLLVEHVGTKIGDVIWANANVDDPDTFGANCEVRGKLYQYNSKVAYPTYAANDHASSTDPVPGFITGEYDVMSETWAEENDPCPAGWRIPTKDEMWALIGGEEAHNKWHYHWYYENQGVYCGSAEAADANQWDTKGCIFMPFAGYRNWEDGVQPEADRVWVQTITRPGQNWQRVCFVFNWTQEMAAANMENNCAFVIRPVADLIEE